MDHQVAALEVQGDPLLDVRDVDADAGPQLVEIPPALLAGLDVRLDQAAEHLTEGRGLLTLGILHQGVRRGRGTPRPYDSSGHRTGTRVVHSVISCDAFV